MYHNCLESLHTRMADYLCILPHLKHYFIRPQNISFPQRKRCMHTTPLHQCCRWLPSSPILAKSFSLISEDRSDKNKTHLPLLRSPSSLYPISQTGLSLPYYPKPFSSLCFHSSKTKQDFFQNYALNLSKQRPSASAHDNRALHQMATITQERNFSYLA